MLTFWLHHSFTSVHQGVSKFTFNLEKMKYDHPLQILSNRRLEETTKELILATVIHLFLFQFSSQQEARGEQRKEGYKHQVENR